MYWFYLHLTKIFVFYNVIVHISTARSQRRNNNIVRSVGGRDALPNEFPYAVRLEVMNATTNQKLQSIHYKHVCTAFVVSVNVTITAAHCCVYIGQHKVVIRYGSPSGRPSEDDKFSEVLSYIQAPSGRTFDHPMMRSNVALLKTQPINLHQYARLSAIDSQALLGQRVSILGYGLTNHSGGFDDTLVLKAPLQVLNTMWMKCDDAYGSLYPLVCAVESCKGQTALCPGDSGGPVVHASGVVGISTKGPMALKCQMMDHAINVNYVDFLEPLSSHIDWIGDIIAEMSHD